MRRLVFATLAGLLAASGAHADPLAFDIRPITLFGLAAVDKPGGVLEFVGGLQVTSPEKRFGGLSGIDMLDADHVLIIGDKGSVVTARLVWDEGRLVGLADGAIEDLFPDGATSKQKGDAEDVALDPRDPTRGVIVRERQANALLAFDLDGGRPENFEPLRVGADNHFLRSNKGLESVAYVPSGAPLAGKIVTIGERPPRGQADIPAWIAGVGKFSVVRRDNFDVSSARFLPGGDLLLLERRSFPPWDIGFRLRRIAGDTIAVGALVDGAVLLDAGMSNQIDNMEGLAVSADADGRTLLTLVSDDNFSPLQRTLILQFALAKD